MQDGFPRRALTWPAVPPLLIAGLLMAGIVSGHQWSKYGDQLILFFAFVITVLIAVLMQGGALVRALARLRASAADRTRANYACTGFAAVCLLAWLTLASAAVLVI